MTGGVPSMDFAAANASPAIGGSPNAPAVAAPGTPQTFQQALGARFTPQAMADMTLRAGAMLAGSAAAGSGLSPEQQALLTQQTEDLRALRDTNRAAYEQRMQGARQLMQQAGYYNPEYMGQQFAASAMNRQAAQTAANVRGLPEAQRAAEERRGRIETGRAMGTAYQQGFGAGVQGQTQTIQAGLQSIPSSFPSLAQEYAGIGNVYNTAANRQRTMQADIGTLFGSVTGPQQAASRNMTDEERRRTT
jgi:hypothetical protein